MVWEVLVVQSCQHKQPIGYSHSAAFIKYSLFALKHRNICLTWAATQVNSVTKIVPFLHLHHLGLPFKDSVRSPFLVLYTWTFKGFPYLLWFLRVVSYFILLFFVGLCVVFPYFRPLDWKPCKIKLLSQSLEKKFKIVLPIWKLNEPICKARKFLLHNSTNCAILVNFAKIFSWDVTIET